MFRASKDSLSLYSQPRSSIEPTAVRRVTAPSRRRVAFILSAITALTAGALVGCSSLDLGPEPDNAVVPGAAAHSLTDQNLQAVLPTVPGDLPGGAAELPTVTVPGTIPAANPETMPAATQPTMTQSAATTPGTQPATAKSARELQAVPEALSVQEAILTGLQNNVNLRVDRYTVPLARTEEERSRAAFDPALTGSIKGGITQTSPNHSKTTTVAVPNQNIVQSASSNTVIGILPGSTQTLTSHGSAGIVDSINATLGYTQVLPTGTIISASLNSDSTFYTDKSGSTLTPSITVTQSLLRGAGLDVNLASLRQAELGTKISQYALRNNAEVLVEGIENAYWTLAYDERAQIIYENALEVALSQLADTSRRVELGSLSPSELPAARAEVEARRFDLINSKSTLEIDRLALLRQLTPYPQQFWNRTIALTTLPFVPTGQMDSVEQHVAVAMRMRPDMNQTKLQIQQGDLQVVVSKNGLLPQLDGFVTIGQTAAGGTLGQSIMGLSGPDYSAFIGLQGSWDPINRAERASYRNSVLSRDQLEETYNNVTQQIELDVRSQYIRVESTRQQIDASRAQRIAAEETLAVEQAKLRAGNSTSLNVAVAQRGLLSAQLTEVQSVTNHLMSLVTLYRLEGSLLYRRGIAAPGSTPVTGPAWH
jgi:outer membrane protein TolC